ncbi:hypothetical protein [Streptosporangium sp. NPDC020145]|uniref:hypothetical protein n=1 Tax=Streptosporangium sp. NPDC020145 TaxID=3154694 RepID=UPI0034136535
MELIQLRGCDGDDCPKVFKTDRGTYVVQGVTFTSVTTPDGESAVEVPADVIQGL